MAERIVDVLSLTSASGWFLAREGDVYEPLVSWALVSVFDEDYPTIGATKRIVGIVLSEIADISAVVLEGRHYYHQSELG